TGQARRRDSAAGLVRAGAAPTPWLAPAVFLRPRHGRGNLHLQRPGSLPGGGPTRLRAAGPAPAEGPAVRPLRGNGRPVPRGNPRAPAPGAVLPGGLLPGGDAGLRDGPAAPGTGPNHRPAGRFRSAPVPGRTAVVLVSAGDALGVCPQPSRLAALRPPEC